jgi:phosphonate transport system substrate-binding protein
MNRRRLMTVAVAAAAFAATGAAHAQSWKDKYKEMVFAVVPAENASGVTERYAPFMAYLGKELGTKVTLRVAQDYAAVIEGMKAGQIHIGYYGPSSYVRAWTVSGGNVLPFVTTVNSDGSIGYYAVVWTKKSNSATKIADLKGKNLCLVDPNSTSGNNVPRLAMSKLGIEPDTFFSKVVYAGSHENAIIGVQQGTCDGAWNWWNSDEDSNFSRMVKKGMVKADDFKIIFKSDLIAGSPYAWRSDLPNELKDAILKAFVEAPKKDKVAFDKLSDGKDRGFQPVTHKDYESSVELQKFIDNLRKKKS